MSTIKSIIAHEILDSRGNPTIETTITLSDDKTVSSSVPSGASTSSYEAFELRDNDPDRYEGKGVLKACEIVNNTLSKIVVGKNPVELSQIDKEMIDLDVTENKSNLGGNSILSVSQAIVKAGAVSQNLKLWEYINKLLPSAASHIPTPTFNIINGGKHGAGNLNIQEFHIIPKKDMPYSKALETGQEVYEKLKEVLIHRNAIHSVGDEGGFAPNLFTNRDAIDILIEAIQDAKLRINEDVFLGLDISATNFFKDGQYYIKDTVAPLTPPEMIEYLEELTQRYHFLFLEDALNEDAWNDWKTLTSRIGNQIMIVGDDLLATNFNRLKKAIDEKAANAILVKPNQAGTISETLEIIKLARQNSWKTIVSHRSGETNDTFIADLAVGVGSDYIKFGAPARGERIAKYNRLLEIERELNDQNQQT